MEEAELLKERFQAITVSAYSYNLLLKKKLRSSIVLMSYFVFPEECFNLRKENEKDLCVLEIVTFWFCFISYWFKTAKFPVLILLCCITLSNLNLKQWNCVQIATGQFKMHIIITTECLLEGQQVKRQIEKSRTNQFSPFKTKWRGERFSFLHCRIK